MAWTPALVELFDHLKKGVTSSLVLEIFDPSKPNLLKTDWSTESMGWMCM